MMIEKKVEQALNDQINAELYSAYIYMSMEAWFRANDLPGCANWMNVQTQEETAHAMKIYNFIDERGGRVLLQAIEAPQTDWDGPLEVFQAAYKHEQYITGRINDLVDIAEEHKDRATYNFLQWYVDEQVEEEANVDEVIGKLKLIKDAPGGLYMFDKEVGQRVFTPIQEGAK